MKNIVSTIICGAISFSLMATEENDTLKSQKNLNEVIIEAQMQTTQSNVTTYYPDRNSKRTAQDAIDLLNQMAIPQININPIDGSITTPGGDNVAIYIDMEPATDAEKEGIRPEDVKKVEYFVFPSDPRFNHEKYVINITLRRYNYGGYAKLQGSGSIMAGQGNGLGYAKMAYKKMTYDFSATDSYTDRKHSGTEQSQVYRFPDNNGGIEEISRKNILDDSRLQKNQFGMSFRAKYMSQKAIISNSFNLTALNQPHNDKSGRLEFSTTRLNGEHYSNSHKMSYIYPRWGGQYFFLLGNGFMFNAAPSFFYMHTKSNRVYTSNNTNILTDATEDAITSQLQLQLNKKLNKHHTIDVNLLGIYYHDKVKYTGNTVASPGFNQFAYGGIIGYTFNKDKIYGQFMVGFAGESNKISGVQTNSFIPLVRCSSQYAFDSKRSLNLSVQYNVNPVEAADKTPDIIQQNELLYKTGNLHLKNTHWGKVSADYTWMPNNKFSLSASTGWSRYFNRPVPVFTPDGPNGMMLQSIENNGDYQDIYIGTSISAKFFKRKLVIKATPKLWFEKTTGIYADKANYLSLSLTGTYYFGKFYCTVYYSPASRGLIQYSLDAISYKGKSSYWLKLGWRKDNWNLSASAINIFRSSRVLETSSLTSRWFEQENTVFGYSSRQTVKLTAGYTFGFGKKVKRGDEIQTEDGANSAIMK